MNSEYGEAPRLRVGELYVITRIDPECEWYSRRFDFEGKIMRCVEVFELEEAAGFCFVNSSDCPEEYRITQAFCFFRAGVSGMLSSDPGKKNRKHSLAYQTHEFLN